MGERIVTVLCDHDLLTAGLAAVLSPRWQVRRVRRHPDDLASAGVLVVDVDDPRHAELLADATDATIVAWTWDAAGRATPSVAVVLPKQADGATTRAVLDEARSAAAA